MPIFRCYYEILLKKNEELYPKSNLLPSQPTMSPQSFSITHISNKSTWQKRSKTKWKTVKRRYKFKRPQNKIKSKVHKPQRLCSFYEVRFYVQKFQMIVSATTISRFHLICIVETQQCGFRYVNSTANKTTGENCIHCGLFVKLVQLTLVYHRIPCDWQL